MTQTLELLERLVAFDTVSSKSNLALIDFVTGYLSARGFALTRLPNADGDKAGLFANLGPPGSGILLSAHTDVVPVAGQAWSRDPFRLTRVEDRLYGRGTTDMKGYLSAMLALADRAAQAPLRAPLSLSISYDEEVGCVGISEMIHALPKALGPLRAAFVGEPTEMAVAIGHKGKVGLRGVASGEAGHSSLAPRFQNALYVATDFIAGLRRLQVSYAEEGARDSAYDIPYTTFHVGTLSGGSALNIVPDHAEFAFEFRHLATDRAEDILSQIENLAGSEITLEQFIAYPGLETPPDAEVVRLGSKLSGTQRVTKVAFGTEAGFFDALGIPTVVCGPGSMAGQGHKPDEFITLSQLEACDAMMARVLDELT